LKFIRLPRFIVFAVVLSGIALLFSCSTKKNTFTRRTYHNLTTHYNVYWNGNESFKQGVADLNSGIRENFNKILPVFNYGTPEEARKVSTRMDRAIEKATIGIRRHSMIFKSKEYNKWIDDCFMLIAKAQFYKQDYNSARRTFEQVMTEYPRQPVYYEALLWVAQCNLQQKKFEENLAKLDELDGLITKETVPFRVRKKLPLVYADYYLKVNNFGAARSALQQGIELNTSGKTRVRLNYILAQIYQQEKNYSMATEYFTKVTRGPASFEMAFNARINMAKSFDVYGGNKAGLEKELRKMLKDSKNKDFRDQIYYALAELSQLDQNDTLTMSYLKQSVATSSGNDFQKTTSALQLAGMYFNRQNYEMAQAYYDTTLQVIPNDYPDYDAINTRTLTLTELVQNLQVVKYEDSLQRLARMPEDQLAAIIQKLIDDYKKEEQRLKEEAERQQMEMSMASNIPNMRNENLQNIGGGGWYFNNPSAISFGYSEFLRKWGRRKLEDNWRLSNKRQVVSSDESDMTEVLPADTANLSDSAAIAMKMEKKSTDPKDPKTYLQKIPKTPEAIALSNKRIEEALTNLGYLYKDDLKDTVNSIKTFENLIERFPDSKNVLRIYYQLYLINNSIPDAENAEKYKNIILNLFPESEYALTLKDPEYLSQLIAKKNRVSSLYEETYNAFEREQYRMVMLYCDEAISNYKDKDLLPRFEYLRAVSQGKIISTDTMVVSLNKLLQKYPSSPVAPLVQEILQKYSKQTAQATAQATGDNPAAPKPQGTAPAQNQTTGLVQTEYIFTSDTTVPDIYKFNLKQTHFFIMMVDENKVNVNAMKVRITDYNLKYFPNENITVNAILLDNGWQMITVSSFGNSEKAMAYYNSITQSEYILSQLKSGAYRSFVISMENYPVFYREKKYQGYINFFNKYYINQ
jgi:tetratricopeptide (TPR) repeat protein